MKIDTVEQWVQLSAKLSEQGYKLWQWHYRYDDPDGFHARFWAQGKHDVEVVTFEKDVQDAVLNYR